MGKKITWKEPVDDTVTHVEINRSGTLYGTYDVATTMDATSDGNAKSSSNTWVTDYSDSDGLRTDWYKIRFYDGTNYSDYSDPITSEEFVSLCTVSDIKNMIETVGRWTDDEIFSAIQEIDEIIYMECGTPLQAIWSPVGKIDNTIQDTYYVGERDVYRIDRLFYGTTTKTELYLDDGYKAIESVGMIKILAVGSSGVTLSVDDDIEIEYVPKIYHKLSLYRTCKSLLEQLDFVSGGTVSKELEVINNKLNDIERLLSHRVGVQLSSDLKHYDTKYGVNRKRIVQDHDRNKYLVSNKSW